MGRRHGRCGGWCGMLMLGVVALLASGRGWAQGGGAAGEAAPVFRTVGRAFEVVGPNVMAVDTAAELARQAWATLAAPLELPRAYATAVVVRLIPAEQWGEAAAFRAWVEPGGGGEHAGGVARGLAGDGDAAGVGTGNFIAAGGGAARGDGADHGAVVVGDGGGRVVDHASGPGAL